MRARAVEFAAPLEVRLVDVDVPSPGIDELVVRTLYSGISVGTELLAYRGEIDPELPLDEAIGALGGTFSFPFRYGYSCVGVAETSARDIEAGVQVFAYHPHQERFVVRSDDVVVLSDADPRAATLFPYVETALQITLDCGAVFERPIVVMGLGPVGLLTSLLLQRAGARVIAVDPSAGRREVAHDLDIRAIDAARLTDHVEESTYGEGVPLVVEASGNPDALAQALPLLAHEGTALVASWYGTKPVTLPLGAEFHRRRLTIRSTQVSTIPAPLSPEWTIARRRERVTSLVTELPLKRLATHEFPFEKASDAFALLDSRDDTVMHIALAYGGQ